MASDDWIKMRKKLWGDGRVRKMSATLRTPRGQVVGALVKLWSLADDYADANGTLLHYTIADIDTEVEIPGFTEALPADWCVVLENGISLPEYQIHNGTTAKRRADDAKRKAKKRRPQNVRKVADKCPQTCGLEKRREEKSIKKESTLSPGAPQTKTKPRKPDPLSDAWRDRFYPEGVPKSQGSKFGKEVATLREIGAEPKQVAIRADNYRRHFEGAALTPTALVKHWQVCATPPAGRAPSGAHDNDQSRFEQRKPDVIA